LRGSHFLSCSIHWSKLLDMALHLRAPPRPRALHGRRCCSGWGALLAWRGAAQRALGLGAGSGAIRVVPEAAPAMWGGGLYAITLVWLHRNQHGGSVGGLCWGPMASLGLWGRVEARRSRRGLRDAAATERSSSSSSAPARPCKIVVLPMLPPPAWHAAGAGVLLAGTPDLPTDTCARGGKLRRPAPSCLLPPRHMRIEKLALF
jgi:hypothetical protein